MIHCVEGRCTEACAYSIDLKTSRARSGPLGRGGFNPQRPTAEGSGLRCPRKNGLPELSRFCEAEVRGGRWSLAEPIP